MEFHDRQLTCLDCNQQFTFTAGEQEFYERKGFKEEPKRCKPCRDLRKVRRDGGGGQARDGQSVLGDRGGRMAQPQGGSDDDDNIGNRAPSPSGGGQRRDDRRGAAPRGGGGGNTRELFDAVCAQCGAAARVPFRPVAGRPVYCRDCYGNRAAES